jgi:molybdopterin-guanine dinucleotide biosynthesis protein A
MIAALILAGGQATRMGGADKAFLLLNGEPLIAHLFARLAPQVDRIAISANGDAGRFNAFPLPVLPDGSLAGKGPLAGIAAGLGWAEQQGAASLITVPVDTPFIPPDLVARLSPAVAVAVYAGRQHHLVAHWPVSARLGLLRFLETAPCKVRDFLAISAARPVTFEAQSDPFVNINTADDLVLAASLAKQQVKG